ncbi:MAG: hypothetical protein MUC78_00060 [Bacteroidales bacterium]|nr:hypothetical protein [Bacteroidales bacterium]
MKNRSFFITSILISIFILPSCREMGSRNMREGEIFFSIRYIKNPSSLPKDLLPRELTISFRNDLFHTELNAPFGNTGITTIINPKEGIYDTYLNMLSFKYCFRGGSDDIQPGFSSMKGISFRETGKRSEICGLRCNQIEVRLPGREKVWYVWYTDEIKVENPNRMTPYREIDGVLMDFFYVIGDAELQFIADEVFVRDIPDKDFEKKKNYKEVSDGFLDSLILKMIAF